MMYSTLRTVTDRRQAVRSLRRGFTLIELLVVISIIAVLASLLLPAISMAKQMGNSTKCLSGQRQVGMAFLAYASDNDDAIAPTKAHAIGVNAIVTAPAGFNATWGMHWFDILGPYVDEKRSGNNSNMWKSGLFWQCPTYSERNNSAKANQGKPGYGRNPALGNPTPNGWWWSDSQVDIVASTGGMTWGNGSWGQAKIWNFATITYASTRILVGDSYDWGLGPDKNVAYKFQGEPKTSGSNPWGDPERHRGKANYLFCDGHVASVQRSTAWLSMMDPATYK